MRRHPAFYGAARTAKHWFAAAVILPINQRRELWKRTSYSPAARRREISRWRRSGKPIPPPHAFKQVTVAAYGRAFALTTLVETGTYLGDMVEAQRARFRQIISIELAPYLYRAARSRFKRARNVLILEGDSGELMESVLKRLDAPALFWLDGHYSAGVSAHGTLETPIQRELETILGSSNDHVILIDDARCFGTGDFPTLDEVSVLVARLKPGWTCFAKYDMLRIHPPTSRPRAVGETRMKATPQ
jgi:hypothetical protein